LSLFLTYDTPWGRIGWDYDRTGWQDLAWVVVQDYGLAIGLLALTLGLLVPLSRRQQTGRALFGVAPYVAALAYVAVASGASADIARLVFNVYFLLLGIGTTYSGIRHGRLGTMNGGLLLVSALIVARFLDVELSFTARGIVFVGLGAAFLGTNLAMQRRGIVS